MNKNIVTLSLSFLAMLSLSTGHAQTAAGKADRFVDALLKKMTLAEKVGQLCQYVGGDYLTGPQSEALNDSLIAKGLAGSVLNVHGVHDIRILQEKAVQNSRLKIPLLFGYDVIHGYKTIFPVPLAESCSWDLDLMQLSAKIAAIETAAAGIHWTFAPMVDIARDPRWGRVVEGAGEDTYLGSKIAAARVKGFQWNLGDTNAVLACAKHFAAYGLPQAGKDYGTVDISDRTLQDIYLPPFKACVDAGVGTFMTSFNEIAGVPSTANRHLLKNILVDEWQFKGFVVSDWLAVDQLRAHGIAATGKDAAELAFNAGTDMDMTDGLYNKYLASLLQSGKVSIEDIDQSVRKILRAKYLLGLFDNPYKFLNTARQASTLQKPEYRAAARDVARKSIVLLKNSNNLLPLSKTIGSVAIIGPLGNNKRELLGSWSARGDSSDVVTLLQGIKNKLATGATVQYEKGCGIRGTDSSGFPAAVALAMQSEVVLLAIGEEALMTGESNSKSTLQLTGVQNELAKALVATGKPVIVILMNGRPLAINWIADRAPALVESWFLGTETGNAIADVLFGDYNPSGKLTITFPSADGQIPVYYNHKNTGRPGDMQQTSTSRHWDLPNAPLYPFGYGLSYTTFAYQPPVVSGAFTLQQPLTVTVKVQNTGKRDGEEIVQLYVHDLVASVTRPVQELKGFKKIFLKAGESKEVQFTLPANELGFYGLDMKYTVEPGEFEIMTGGSSDHVQRIKVTLSK